MAVFADPVAEKLNKWTYNPNQPRQGGRFSSGGGQGAQQQPAPPKLTPAQQQAAQYAAVNQAAVAAAKPKPKPSVSPGGGRPPRPKPPVKTPPPRPRNQSSASARQAQDLRNRAHHDLEQAKELGKRIKQLRSQLRALKKKISTQNSGQVGSAAGASSGTTQQRQQQSSQQGGSSPAQYHQSQNAQVKKLQGQIKQLTQQQTSLREQAQQLLHQAARKAAAPEIVKEHRVASTLTDDLTFVSFPIEKTEHTPEGDVIVYGKATDGTVDSDDQIVDPNWSGPALKTWLESGGNVRVQHNATRDPAGVGMQVDLNRDGDGAHYLKALVVEPTAQRLVEKGVLRAFSVGIMRPRIVTDTKARGGRIVGGELGEVSLVDRPANRNCSFTLVKADKGGAPQWVGKVAGDIPGEDRPTPATMARMLNKMHAPGPQRPVPELGKVPQHPFANPVANRLADALREDALLAKRNFDPGVGGGVDRDKLPETDFAGPNRSFPIVTQGDVSDAASLAHHADNPGAVRAAIKRIARRKWPDMKLPPSLDGGSSKSEEEEEAALALKGKDGGKEPTKIHVEGDGDKDGDGDGLFDADGDGDGAVATRVKGAAEENGDEEEETGRKPAFPGAAAPFKKKPAAKGAKSSGEGEDADGGKDDDTGGGGSDDDESDDGDITGREEDGLKAARGVCPGCGQKVKSSHAFCPGCGKKLAVPDAVKAGDKTCPECGKNYHADSKMKRCENCGAKLPTAKALKGRTPTSGGVKDKETKPVPAHREPDGASVEDFEDDAGMQEGDAESHAEPAPTWGARKSDAPYGMMRAHDALCAAYHPAEVLKEYPSLGSLMNALDPEGWRDAAMSVVAAGNLVEGEKALALARSADFLTKADRHAVEDARAELYKSFTSMYPSVHLTPGQVSADRFKRPYISAGHAPLSKEPRKADPSANEPPGSRPATSFQRGPLTAGHERSSPGNTGGPRMKNLDLGTGTRETALAHMQFMHDHLADEYQGVCPMGSESQVKTGDKGGWEKGKFPPPPEDVEEGFRPKKPKKSKTTKAAKADAKADTLLPETIVKSLVIQAATAVREELETTIAGYKSQLETQSADMAAMRRQISELGSQPDPAAAPMRGAIIRENTGGAGAGERRSPVEKMADRQAEEKLQWLRSLANSGDPVTRETAQAQIRKLLTAP